MNPHLTAVAERQLGVFTTVQAMEAGYSDDECTARLRSRQWEALRRGVYLDADRLGQAKLDGGEFHRVLAVAGVLALKPGATVSHISAGALHTLPLLNVPGTIVHATRPEGPPRAYRGLRVHQLPLPAGDRTAVGAVPVTTIARAAVDCAHHLDFRDAVVMTEAALRRPNVASDDLWDAMAGLPRRLHRPVERVIHFARNLSESPGESLSRLVFLEGGLPDPEQQVEIHDGGELVARVDFLWRDLLVVGEFDGRIKYNNPDALWKEKLREDQLRELGYEVVRFTWQELTNHPEVVIARIRSAMSRSLGRNVR